ncbi:Transcriptional regulator, AraC family [Acidisarcina polymorpha]|uniref:Transcriptional regulator, AraC family n=1 Tax=Acidisarcina polymorpha TaxID=2211140 RepID=A0A2Z5G969_9BACT|nr:Transcriptional regulator, AraC family [Acidisarcina polymorpha]
MEEQPIASERLNRTRKEELTLAGYSEERRVFVRAGKEQVPLFKQRPILDSRRSPWRGLILEKHHHAGCEIPVHDHESLCLHFQTGGQVDMDWLCSGRSGRERSVPGSMMLLPAGTRDSVIWHGSTQRIVAAFEPALLADATEQMGLRGLCDFKLLWSFRDDQVGLLLDAMNREMASGWGTGALYGDLLSMALSVALVRKYGELSKSIPHLRGGLSQRHIKRVIAYIEDHLHEDIRLEELANLNSLSRYHFARAFRESLGETPYQYILKTRVQRAKRLLLVPGSTVSDVAARTGFSDPSQFTRMFRKITGATPLEWRRNA